LFLSFQRYVLLILAISTVPFGLTCYLFGFNGWALCAYAPVFLILNFFASRIASQWPLKILVVKRAYAHLSREQFRPERYVKYCDDPCWRVVVNHILKKAGFKAMTRREMLASYRQRASDMSSMVVLVNREKGFVQTITNGQVQTTALASKTGAGASD
jgi:hypothetical protein